MFIGLMPLLGERTVMLTVARIDKNRIRVNVIPTRKGEDETAALCALLSFSGTPEEVDGEMARNLGRVRSFRIVVIQ
jgi:PRTRC genetic system protein E